MNEIQRKFSETLLDVVANSQDAQEYRYFWAIEEGFKRTDLFTQNTYTFNITPTARKRHKCEQGECTIKTGEKYFRLGDRYLAFNLYGDNGSLSRCPPNACASV